jgi:hypothetical protein
MIVTEVGVDPKITALVYVAAANNGGHSITSSAIAESPGGAQA